ncbi:MAG: DUF3568 domain-containing protein [Candidatus Omnitrophica bacterium]|nr:DUF3568 domain-containing protein [Candidatus Omnitrophota bacterium]
MKKLIVITGIVIASVFILAAVRDSFIKVAVKVGGSHVLGAPVKIDGLSLGIVNQSINIKGFKIYNPKGFPKGILVDIPIIKVKYDLPALLKKKLHLREIVIDLKEVAIVKNKDGKLNVDSLKVAQKEDKSPDKKPKEKASAQMPMQIDLLNLSIGKAVFTDYSKGENPSVEVFDLGVKERIYKNITSAQQLATLVLVEAMKGTTIKSASIYGATALAGVAFFPVGIAAVLTSKDSAEADFNADYDKIYDVTIEAVRGIGKISNEDRSRGTIKGNVSGSNVTVKISKKNTKTSHVTVSARKLMLPKPKIASEVLDSISERLK